jgi:hypothetical protein
VEALQRAAPGDAVLPHGCCHNPTGVDPRSAFWQDLANVVVARGLILLVDMPIKGSGAAGPKTAPECGCSRNEFPACWSPCLAQGQGMFAILPLSVAEIDLLQSD